MKIVILMTPLQRKQGFWLVQAKIGDARAPETVVMRKVLFRRNWAPENNGFRGGFFNGLEVVLRSLVKDWFLEARESQKTRRVVSSANSKFYQLVL